MEADWSVEIGADLPTIDVPWEAWVDLRTIPDTAAAIADIDEGQLYPELAAALLDLGSGTAAVTSKCDVFSLDVEDADPSIAELGADLVRYGLGSYIDFAFVNSDLLHDLASCETLVRKITRLRLASVDDLPFTSVEIVIREGSFFGAPGFGLTVYALGYGPDPEAARSTWAKVMRISASITMEEITATVIERRQHGFPTE